LSTGACRQDAIARTLAPGRCPRGCDPRPLLSSCQQFQCATR
jgi:hypothetical protein